MMRYCEDCLESFDTEKEGAGFFFCSKCVKKLKGGDEYETN